MNLYTKIGLGIGIFVIADTINRQRTPKPIVMNLPKPMRGACIPPFGIFITPKNAMDPTVIAHELCHWQQYQRLGLIGFAAKYIGQSLSTGYGKMGMEKECRQQSGESNHCVNHYRQCYG